MSIKEEEKNIVAAWSKLKWQVKVFIVAAAVSIIGYACYSYF